MNRLELKMNAKEQIQGKVWKHLVLMLIMIAIDMTIGFVAGLIPIAGSVMASVASIIITPILSFGLILNYINMYSGFDIDYSLMFKGFGEKFGQIWCTYALVGIYTFLWSLLFVIPGIVKSYSYMFAPYILAENPDMSAREIIKKSKDMTYGHKFDLFVLQLSFFGWALLTVVTLGIASIYVTPYMQQTMTNAYYKIKQEYELSHQQ